MKDKLVGFFREYYEYLQKASLRTMLSVAFTLVSVLVIVIVSLSYSRHFSKSTEKLMTVNSGNVLDQVILNMENYLHDMMSVSNTAYYSIIKNFDIKKDQEEFQDKMDFLSRTNNERVRNIALFRLDGQLLSSYPSMAVNQEIDIKQEEWFVSAVNRIENMHFSTPYVENKFYSETDPYEWIVTLSRSVDLTENGVIVPAVFVINIKMSEIEKIINSVNISETGYVYMIDSEGTYIYHPHQQLINSHLVTEEKKSVNTFDEGSHMVIKDGQKQQVTVKSMGYSGWKAVGVSPVSDYLNEYLDNRNYLLLSMIIASIALFLLNLLISSRLSNPIRNLEKAVLKIEQDITNCEIPCEGSSEVRQLSQSLVSMTDTLRRLMDDAVKEESEKRKKEMIALQSQINPHFLYNTLDSTIWMIESERYEGAKTMITSLAHFFRISLSKGDNVITLEQEVSHVESYLKIQKIRYKNKFEYFIYLDEHIKEAKTVKLIIQPLVENAIYHAMDYLYEEGQIDIFVMEQDGLVTIKVEDNGPGMTANVVASLRQGLYRSNSHHRGSGIGLKNVDERIKLFFGQVYGVTITSEPDEGTIVTITFPYEPMNSIEEVVEFDEEN